jgi:hypothetical protein
VSAVFPHDVGSTLREFRKRIRDLEAAASSGLVRARGAYFTGTQSGVLGTRAAHFNAFDWTLVAGDASLLDTSTNRLSVTRSGLYAATVEIATIKQLAVGAEWTPLFDPECTPWGNPFGTFTIDFPNYRDRWYAPGSKFVSRVAHLQPWRFNDDIDNGGAGADSLLPEVFYDGTDGNLTGGDQATAKLWVTYMSVYQDVAP